MALSEAARNFVKKSFLLDHYIYLVTQDCDESKVLLLYMFTEGIKLNIEKY